jgi:hypothetical protein
VKRYPFVVVFFVFVASVVCPACEGVTTVGPSNALTVPADAAFVNTLIKTPPVPSPIEALPLTQVITGTVFPLGESAPCFVERFPCQVFEFVLPTQGTITVRLDWDGQPRAMLVQLFWGDGLLAHEDVAPRSGPSQIAFRRPLMEANTYRVRVVSLEPDHAMPFTLTLALTAP